MKNIQYLIIGGGVAGTTAGETLRKNDSSATIAIVSDELYRLYSRIMLSKPNFFLEKIPFEQIWLKKEEWYRDNNIELMVGRTAVALDPQKKIVTLNNGENLQYGKLLLALGGCVRPWTVPGSDKQGVHYIRTLDDAKAIIQKVKTIKKALSIGGGFVSFEMCEMLRMAGIEVNLILRESYFWEPLLDQTSGRIIEAALEKGGVRIFRNAEVSTVEGDSLVRGAILKDSQKLPCELIMVGIGVQCPLSWLEPSGIKVNRGIVANEYLETNIPDIWTAGDAAEFYDVILGEQIQLGNWANAQMQGRTAALNMAGTHEPFRLVSFYTTQGFGIAIAFVGDIRPGSDRTIITRGTLESGAYGRILVKDGEIIGATLINRSSELAAISKLIEKDFKIAGHEKELGDPAFNLTLLLK